MALEWSPRPAWYDHARCVGYPSEIFYGFPAERPQRRARREAIALALCADCPVQDLCYDEGQHEGFGIWGGTTPEDRGFDRTTGAPLPPAVAVSMRHAA